MPVAAAVALVTGGGGLWWGVRSEPAADNRLQPQVAAAGKPDPVPAPDVGVPPVVTPPDERPGSPAAGDRVARGNGTFRAAPVVRATGFVSIPGADGLPDFESGEIVRVEIPLTSLPTYGIEILPDARGTPVAADLLVGQDGQARAIRLVQAGAGS